MLKSAFVLVALSSFLLPLFAGEETAATLKVGDAAPALTVGKWIKRDPIQKFESGKVYVVEFWATWCGPCRQSIPHLTKMQADYPKITFIGQDCMEQDTAGVAPFVEQMGDKMNYWVALDDTAGEPGGKMAKNWLHAAAQEGIPAAFVVGKDTKIAWICHPMELEHIIKQVDAGTFDPKKELEVAAARKTLETAIQSSLESKDFVKALASTDELIKSDPENAGQLEMLKFRILLMKGDAPAAMTLAGTLVAKMKDDAQGLNELAWTLVDPANPIEKADVEVAAKAAERANEVSGGKDAAILDTLARVYATKGNLDKAIETQTKAVEKADEGMKEDLKKSLEEYKTKKNPPPAVKPEDKPAK